MKTFRKGCLSVRQLKRWYWFVDLLPSRLVYFCAMRVGVHATTGQYSRQVVPELTFMDAVKRFEDQAGV